MFVGGWGSIRRVDKAEANAPHEANFLKLDSSKLKKTFGWQPHWHIDEAVSRVIEWTKVYEAGGDIPAVMDKQINDYITKG